MPSKRTGSKEREGNAVRGKGKKVIATLKRKISKKRSVNNDRFDSVEGLPIKYDDVNATEETEGTSSPKKERSVLSASKRKKLQKEDGSSKIKKLQNEETAPMNLDNELTVHNEGCQLKERKQQVVTTKPQKKLKKIKGPSSSDNMERFPQIKLGKLNPEEVAAPASQCCQHESLKEIVNTGECTEEFGRKKSKTKRRKTKGKSIKRKFDKLPLEKDLEQSIEDAAEVYEISSADEACSTGMKKWINEYKQSRPGLDVLQQRIDEFIIAYEEQQEKEKKEREELAAKDGWTVVVHQKGRKKITEPATGTVVGAVSQAAVVNKLAKKKTKDVALDFYRYKKREAQVNEIMKLQDKFEQEKKKIQEMKAARKFRPY